MILQIEVTEEELQYLKQIAEEKGFSNPEAYLKSISLPASIPTTPKRRTKARDLLALPRVKGQLLCGKLFYALVIEKMNYLRRMGI